MRTLTFDDFKTRKEFNLNRDVRLISILSQKLGLDFMPLIKD
jgi:hypothetical protein